MYIRLPKYCLSLIDTIPTGVYILVLVVFIICLPVIFKLFGAKKGAFWGLAIILTDYIILLLGSMVVFRKALEHREYHLKPFWSYHTKDNSGYVVLPEHIMNVVIFLPIGLLLAILYRRMGLLKITAIGLLLSCMIEALQFIFKRGVCEIDDVMNNTLGCFLGAVIVFGAYRLCRVGHH